MSMRNKLLKIFKYTKISRRQKTVFSLAMILFLFVVPFFATIFFREQLSALSTSYGYQTVAVIALLTNSTFVIPTPAFMPLLVETAYSNSVFWVAALYAFCSAFAESMGYLIGLAGRGIEGWRKSRFYQPIEQKMQGNKFTGWLLLFLLGVAPIALFDIGAAIAGNTKYPWRWFWLATFLGRWVKYLYLIPLWGVIEVQLEQTWTKGLASLVMILAVTALILFFERGVIWQSLRNFANRRGK